MANAKKKSVFEKFEAEVVRDAGNYVKEQVRRKVVKIGELSILVILGFFLVSFGVASLLGQYYPILGNGFNFLIIGFLFLVISFFMKI